MFQRTSLHFRRRSKYIRRKPTNANICRRAAFFNGSEQRGRSDDSKRFKSSSASPSSAAFSEAAVQHEEEETDGSYEFGNDSVYGMYSPASTMEDDQYAIHDPANNLATYELRDRDEDQGCESAQGIVQKLRGKRLMRVDRYKVDELEYLSGESGYAGLPKVAEQLRDAVIGRYGEDHLNGSTVDDYERQLASEFELMRDNALRQIQSFAEQQQFDVTDNEMRRDVAGLIHTWWKPLLKKVIEERKQILDGNRGQDRSSCGVYFVALKPEVITLCALQTLLNTMVTKDTESDVISGQKIVTMALNMGKAIENEIIRESLLRSGKRWLKETIRKDQNDDDSYFGDEARSMAHENGDDIPGSSQSFRGETEIGAIFEHMRQNERFRSTQIPRTEAKLAEATKRMLKNEEAWSPRTHVKVGSIILKLMLESLTVSMRLDDERFDEYIYFEKYLLEKPSWTKKYKNGFRSDKRIFENDEANISTETVSDNPDEHSLLTSFNRSSSENEDGFAMEHLDLINRLRSKDDLHANLFQRVQGKTKLVSDIPEQIIHNEIRKVPALYHTYCCKDGKRIGVLRLHPKVFDDLRSLTNILNLNSAKYKPMVVPPLPWRTSTKGVLGLALKIGSCQRKFCYRQRVA